MSHGRGSSLKLMTPPSPNDGDTSPRKSVGRRIETSDDHGFVICAVTAHRHWSQPMPLEFASALPRWIAGEWMMARKYLLALLTFVATVFTIGQVLALAMTPPGEPEIEGDMGVTHGHALPPLAPLAIGRVVAIDRATGRITLEYLPIPRLFLDGGTRVFHIRETVSLEGVGPGDKVRFEVERDARTYVIIRMTNSN